MLDASERKALMLSTFAAACIAFAPGQVVSGAALLVASILLWRWDARHRARERAPARDDHAPARDDHAPARDDHAPAHDDHAPARADHGEPG